MRQFPKMKPDKTTRKRQQPTAGLQHLEHTVIGLIVLNRITCFLCKLFIQWAPIGILSVMKNVFSY